MALLLSDTIQIDMAARAELDIDTVDDTLSDYLRRQTQQASYRLRQFLYSVQFPVFPEPHATDLCASHSYNHSNQHGHRLLHHNSVNSSPNSVSCKSPCVNSSQNSDKSFFSQPRKLHLSDEQRAEERLKADTKFSNGHVVLRDGEPMALSSSVPLDADNALEGTRRLDLLSIVATLKLIVLNRSGYVDRIVHGDGEHNDEEEIQEEMFRFSETMPRTPNRRRAIVAQKLRDLIHRLGIMSNEDELDPARETEKRHGWLPNKIHHRKRKRLQDLSFIRTEEDAAELKVEEGFTVSDEVLEAGKEADMKMQKKKNSVYAGLRVQRGFKEAGVKKEKSMLSRSCSSTPVMFKKETEIVKDSYQQCSRNVNEIQIKPDVPISEYDDEEDDDLETFPCLDDDDSKSVSGNSSCLREGQGLSAMDFNSLCHNTTETKECKSNLNDGLHNSSESADVVLRPKRARSQMLPTKFSDSILQPWGRIIR